MLDIGSARDARSRANTATLAEKLQQLLCAVQANESHNGGKLNPCSEVMP
jgi:hypothetical protein